MKIILLSAGKGERLLPLTRYVPKPLIQLGNKKTLVDAQLEKIKKSGVIDEIIMVVGYKFEQIEAKLKFYKENGYKIKTIFNPFINYSENLISLWLAKPEMDGNFMISNGDNIFEPDVYEDLAEKSKDGITLVINKKKKYVEDDMKVIVKDGTVLHASKELKGGDAEAVGLAIIKGKKHIELFKQYLENFVRAKRLNEWWPELFNVLSENGIPVHPFEIDGQKKWQEIDFHLDLEGIKELILT